MKNISAYNLILEMDRLKLVFRNTLTNENRQESTAEHSWSVCMIILILMDELKKEFNAIDELKIIKLALIHDVVEIYAGDVSAFDADARKGKEKTEADAMQHLMKAYPEFGPELHHLWHEFESHASIEAKIAKAADAICPIFQRLQTKQPYPISLDHLEKTKYPHFMFSQTFRELYERLKVDLLTEKLIEAEA